MTPPACQAPAGLVLEDTEVRADVVEVEGRPEPEQLRRGRGRSGLPLAHRAHAPGAVAHGQHVARLDLETPALDLERPRPAAELGEPGRVHHDLGAGAQRRARLLDRRRARSKHEVAGDPARVRRHAQAQRAQRLDHLDRDRADARLAALERREARGVHGELPPVCEHAEGSIHHAAVGIEAERRAEEQAAVLREAVEEVPVVEVLVAGRRVRDRLGRLVQRDSRRSG